MPENKTKPTGASVDDFIAAVEIDTRRADAKIVLEMMRRVTGETPVMWGPTMIGFGKYAYKYKSGHGGEFFLTGFSPRKAHLVLYIMPGYGQFDDVMARLGKHKTGRACLYVNKLADIDIKVLEELVGKSVAWMREHHHGDALTSR